MANILGCCTSKNFIAEWRVWLHNKRVIIVLSVFKCYIMSSELTLLVVLYLYVYAYSILLSILSVNIDIFVMRMLERELHMNMSVCHWAIQCYFTHRLHVVHACVTTVTCGWNVGWHFLIQNKIFFSFSFFRFQESRRPTFQTCQKVICQTESSHLTDWGNKAVFAFGVIIRVIISIAKQPLTEQLRWNEFWWVEISLMHASTLQC